MRINRIGATYLTIGAILAAFAVVLVAVLRTTPAQGVPVDLIRLWVHSGYGTSGATDPSAEGGEWATFMIIDTVVK